jgi:hypothetical protein
MLSASRARHLKRQYGGGNKVHMISDQYYQRLLNEAYLLMRDEEPAKLARQDSLSEL